VLRVPTDDLKGPSEITSIKEAPASQLYETIKGANQAIFAFDEEGIVCYANHAAAAVLGRPINKILGSAFKNLFPNFYPGFSFSLKLPQIFPLPDSLGANQMVVLIPSRGGLLAICVENGVLYRFGEAGTKDWTAKYRFADIIGNSKALLNTKQRARQVAATDATVLITGESGTGKELFAHAIHAESKRRSGPFVRINCSSIPTELLEAELFGYEAGAFTGAKRNGRSGMFELANMGTIFLDEISQMNWDIQAKLLRVLQEKEIVRVGGTKPTMVDFRLILATNALLEEMVTAGRFRSDLFYRINVFPIVVPPLRERKEDIGVLIEHFSERLQKGDEAKAKRLSIDVLRVFEDYSWPGNVRELLHVLEQLFISSVSNVIDTEKLPPYFFTEQPVDKPSKAFSAEQNYKMTMEKAEREIIIETLKRAAGNRKKAAELLGIHRSGLYQKIKKYGL
jgi:transcriptional regulator with PAS, ATPase and Fis domain